MKTSNSNLIPREELESLLADYATGLLETGLKARVEASLAVHPDLLSQASTLQQAFAVVNRDARNAAIDYQTRNLSVHVVNALGNKKRNPYRHLAWLLPAATTAALFIAINVGFMSDDQRIAGNGLASAAQKPTVRANQQRAKDSDNVLPSTSLPAISVATSTNPDSGKPTVRKQKRLIEEPLRNITHDVGILDDLVTEQIVDRIASEVTIGASEEDFTISDAELDVLLAAVVSNETL